MLLEGACLQFTGRRPERADDDVGGGSGGGGRVVFFPLYQPSSRFFTNFWCRAGHNGSIEKPAKLVPDESRRNALSLSRPRSAFSIFLYRIAAVISIARYAVRCKRVFGAYTLMVIDINRARVVFFFLA